MTELELRDQVWVVTGGSRGIGRAVVMNAVERGAQVLFCARHLNRTTEALVRRMEEQAGSGCVSAIEADITQKADVDLLFDQCRALYGKVNVLINNAGLSLPHVTANLAVDDWDAMLATNLTGSFLTSQRAVREFLNQGTGGRIVSVGSVMQNGAPSNAGYATSKGGLLGLTKAIARSYDSFGIQAFLIVGGFAETEMTRSASKLLGRMAALNPLKRLALVEELASAILFAGSPRATALRNGQTIYVSGGLNDPPAE